MDKQYIVIEYEADDYITADMVTALETILPYMADNVVVTSGVKPGSAVGCMCCANNADDPEHYHTELCNA